MGRKTLILREDQFNEICGTNTAYLDNSGDYAEDGTVKTKAAGAVSDSNGEKKYSEPITTDDYAHTLAPETLFALLFRNGGHGLWGHWGSGLRANHLNESNSELEGNTYELDLGDGKKKHSYTSLTTEKHELEQEIQMLRMKGNLTPQEETELEKKINRLYRINQKLGMETKRVKDSKRIKKDIYGQDNAFIKPHSKDSKNGKAHTKKVKDPNVGTGFITYA